MSRYKYSDIYEKMSKGFKGGFIVVPILGILVSGYLLILQGWNPWHTRIRLSAYIAGMEGIGICRNLDGNRSYCIPCPLQSK